MEISPEEKKVLNKALGMLKKTLLEVKPKVMIIKDKIRNGEVMSDEQKLIIGKYQRALKLIKKSKRLTGSSSQLIAVYC